MKKLRFAPLVRVSSEEQSKKGESLNTQTKDLTRDIKELNGVVYKWFSGQEHSSPGDERKIFDSLLRDAEEGKFNAVIMHRVDREGRDLLKTLKALELFRKHDIRFFVRRQEFDLHDENDVLMLHVQHVIAEYTNKRYSKDAIQNRISLAEQGRLPVPCPPYGRIYDKEKREFSLCPVKQKAVEDACKRYLNGESIYKICKTMPPYSDKRAQCKEMGISPTALLRIFRHRLGDKWTISFQPKLFPKIREEITITIPRLVDVDTEAQIQRRLDMNRCKGGKRVHSYSLQGFVYCSKCGHKLTGQLQGGGKRYYRHPTRRGCDPRPFNGIPADLLEKKVWEEVGAVFTTRKCWEKAVLGAFPDKVEKGTMKKEEKRLQGLIQDLKRRRSILYEDRLDASITKEQWLGKDAPLKQQEQTFRADLAEIQRKQALLGDFDAFQEVMKLNRCIDDFSEMLAKPRTDKEIKEIIEALFTGEGLTHKNPGVYVTGEMKSQRKSRLVSFEIVGAIRPEKVFELPKLACVIENRQTGFRASHLWRGFV